MVKGESFLKLSFWAERLKRSIRNLLMGAESKNPDRVSFAMLLQGILPGCVM